MRIITCAILATVVILVILMAGILVDHIMSDQPSVADCHACDHVCHECHHSPHIIARGFYCQECAACEAGCSGEEREGRKGEGEESCD